MHNCGLGANRGPCGVGGGTESIGAARRPPRGPMPTAVLVGHGSLRVRRGSRVLLGAAHEIERGVERLVVLRIRRGGGLRAGLLVAFGLEMTAQRNLSPRVRGRFVVL